MDLALNNLQRLICHKTHQTKQWLFVRIIKFLLNIIILSMLLCISGRVLVYLEYPSALIRLHQGLDYIVYLQFHIGFYCITVVLKV